MALVDSALALQELGVALVGGGASLAGQDVALLLGIEQFVAYVGSGSPRFYLPLDQQQPSANFAQFVILTTGIEPSGGSSEASSASPTSGEASTSAHESGSSDDPGSSDGAGSTSSSPS